VTSGSLSVPRRRWPRFRPWRGAGTRWRRAGTRWPDSPRRLSVPVEAARVVAITAVVACLIILFAPPAGDAAAHLYRTYLVDKNILVWDTFWYRGNFPIFTYSLLYYPVAALVGNTAAAVAGVLSAAGAFSVIILREWGRIAVWPARAFGVVAAGPLVTGTFPYGLGLAAGLFALVAAQRNKRWMAFGMAVVTLGLSPLAFAFLVLALAAAALARPLNRNHLLLGVGLPLLLSLATAAVVVLSHAGRYPFGGWSLLAVATVAGCGFALASHAPRARVLAAFFALWLVASVVLFFVPTPFGETVTRLRYIVFPLMLATVLFAGWRPRWLAVVGLSVAALYNILPYAVGMTVQALDSRAAEASFWQPAIDYLRANNTPDNLVEVVATENHWEAYWLPRAGIPLVRGWYRQTDIQRNPLLYASQITPQQYRHWLDRNAVRYVVLPRIRLDVYTGGQEARLVRSRQTGLIPVLRARTLAVYEVPHATPLLTGPAPAAVTALEHQRIDGWVQVPGRYELRLEWSPYWRVLSGDACIGAGPDEATIDLSLARAGPFRLAIDERPRDLVKGLSRPPHC
jgi:hypothetical protein